MGHTKIRKWSQRSQLFWVLLYAASGVHKNSLCNTKASADWSEGCVWAEQTTCSLCAGCLQIALPSAVGDWDAVKLSFCCPVLSLTQLRCPTKPLLMLMPAQLWCLWEGAEGTEASYLSCSHKYERWEFQTLKGNWGNILFLSEGFPSVRYEVSFCSGCYQVCALNTLLIKIVMAAL